jgi:hypothetical protein
MGNDEYPPFRCDFAETKGLDTRAQDAVDARYQATCETATGVYFEAGDLLVIDDHSTFHGRTSFPMSVAGGPVASPQLHHPGSITDYR